MVPTAREASALGLVQHRLPALAHHVVAVAVGALTVGAFLERVEPGKSTTFSAAFPAFSSFSAAFSSAFSTFTPQVVEGAEVPRVELVRASALTRVDLAQSVDVPLVELFHAGRLVVVAALVAGASHGVDRKLLPAHEELRAGVDDEVAEFCVGLVRIADSNSQMISELSGKDGIEIARHFIRRRSAPSGLNVFLDLVLKGRDAHCHALEIADWVGPDRPDLVPQLLQADIATAVDQPDNPPPSIKARAHLRLLQHHQSVAGEAVVEEPPHGAV